MGWASPTRQEVLDVARSTGETVIEAWSAWDKGAMGTVYGPMLHHTGSAWSFGKNIAPTLKVVREGRADLQNSLCMYYIDYAGVIYCINNRLSWHAGAGSWQGITDGNGHFAGIEAESNGVQWTAETLESYKKLSAAILRKTGKDVNYAPRHAEYALPKGRKSDFSGTDATVFKNDVQFMLNNGIAPEVDMLADERQALFSLLSAVIGGNTNGENNFHWLEKQTRQFVVFRNDPTVTVNGKKGDGGMVLAAPGIWYTIADMNFFNMFMTHGLCAPDYKNVSWNVFDLYRTIYLGMQAQVNTAAIASAVQASLPSTPPTDIAFTDEQIQKLAALLDDETAEQWKAKVAEQAKATADEIAKRVAD